MSRRVELGFKTRQAFSEASGLSTKTLGEIERADRTSYDPATLAQVEQALRWPAGHTKTLVQGEAPRSSLFDGLTPLPREIAYLVHVFNELPDEERPDFLRFVELLAEMGALKVAKAQTRPTGG